MKLDRTTTEWLGKLIGRAAVVPVQFVGNGSYGLVQETTCGDKIERHLKYMGFESASEAAEFAEFIKTQQVHSALPADLPAHPIARAQAIATFESNREHVRDHVTYVPICMYYAVPDSALNEIRERGCSTNTES